jgi:photosystem II stability/assembly factor-like uncharacterized protein
MIPRPSETRAEQKHSAGIVLFATLLTTLAIVTATLLAANAQAAAPIENLKSKIENPEVLAWRLAPAVTSANLRDIHMVSATDGWAVGENGTVLRYDGSSWSPVNINPQPSNETLVDVHMLSATDGYIGGWGESGASGTIYHWDGTGWTLVYNAPRDINRIDAVASNDVWASGVGQIYHYNGTSWTLAYNVPDGQNVFAIQMVSANEGWAVGANQLIVHYLNGSWTILEPSPSPQTLYDSFFTAPNDGWAVGFTDSTYVMHYDGVEWTRAYSPTAQLLRMYFLSATDGWAVSYSSILHYDGIDFTEVPNPYPDGLNSIYMLTPTDGWIVGTSGAMLHYSDDSTPTPTLAPPTGTATETPVQATSTSTPQATATSAPATNTPVAPTATASPCAIEFADLPSTNTFYTQVRCLACRGIMGGYADNTFRPNNDITRGQLSKIVANSAAFNEPAAGQTFEDVEPDNTFYVYVERMAGRGIIGGYTCGGMGEPCGAGNKPYFRPNANATRGQISKIVSEAKGYSDPQAGQTFEDVAVGSTFHLWIERLASRGIMGGYACGGTGEPCGTGNKPYFRPNANATRGQTSKIVANTFFPGCQP